MKLISILALLASSAIVQVSSIAATLLIGCQNRTVKNEPASLGQEQTVSLFEDNNFANGLYLMGIDSRNRIPDDTLYPFGKTSAKPSWNVLQWFSRYNLKGTKPLIENDTVIYQNEGKTISFLRTDNTILVGLEVVGSKEYIAPRREGEAWPHLLIEQRFDNKIPIDSLNKLIYTIKARLMYDENKMGQSFDRNLHTAQISLYLAVKNTNKHSPGDGDYFWFGMPLYDYRYPEFSGYAAQDLGKADATKKFIYTVANKELFYGSLQDKQWISINKDVYPMLVRGFNVAKEKGFLGNTTISDLAIASANLGWEVPGTFDCGIQFKNLTLTAFLK